MEEWKQLLGDTITSPEELAQKLSLDKEIITTVHQKYPLRINPYYLSLIKDVNDPIWRQAVPDAMELDDTGFVDPLAEEDHSPVPNLTHRYPDRVLFYVTSQCAMYCRFCTRKRKVGYTCQSSTHDIASGLQYIREHPEIRDVVLSGGDPLIMEDDKIEYLLSKLREISHIQIIRIGTRIPVTLPQRITEKLCSVLKKYHPLYINCHFNHPREISEESTRACAMLAEAGIPLGNQSVLLKGVNDSPVIMKELVQKLLAIRVKPYYLYQMDLVSGADHFRTDVSAGLSIIKMLRGHTSGLAVPHYVVDTPKGGGKVALIPEPIVAYNDDSILLKNYEGDVYSYPTTLGQLTPVDMA